MATSPTEKKFHKTKAKPILALILFGMPLLVTGYAIIHYFLYGSKNGIVYLLVMLVVFAICAYYVFNKVRIIITNEPLVVLNQSGIVAGDTPFVSWNDIATIRVETVGSGNHILSYLNFEYKGGNKKILINELLVTPEELYKTILRFRADSDFNPTVKTKKVDEKEEMMKKFFEN